MIRLGITLPIGVLVAACNSGPEAAPCVGADCGSRPDAEPIPADALYLDPAGGSAAGDGSATAPWPGLADAIAANLVAGVADGATLVLRDGSHGEVALAGEHAVAVTLRAAPGARPELGRLQVDGSGWHVRGVTVSPELAAAPYDDYIVALGERATSTDLVLEDSFVYTALDTSGWSAGAWMGAHSGVLLGRNGTGLVVRNTHVRNTRFGIAVTSWNAVVEGNLISDFSGDGLRLTRDGATVTDNVIKNVYVTDADGDDNHDDAIQCFLFNVGTGTVRDITLRGNLVVNRDDEAQAFAAPVQAIGFFDGPLIDFVVEDNVIFVDHWHGVSLYDAQGATIANNLAYSRWGTERRPWVMLGEKLDQASGNTVTGNVAHSFDFAADATVVESGNTEVTPAVAEARLAERLAAIETVWGAVHPVSGARRLPAP